MKLLHGMGIVLLLCTGTIFTFEVRVLLSTYKFSTLPEFFVASPKGFTLSSLDGKISHLVPENDLRISYLNGRIRVNGNALVVSSFFIRPNDIARGFSLGKDVAYDGTLLVMAGEDELLVINYVPLEKYVYSVLRWEGWPKWPIEAKRAFAIVCRTYVLHKVFANRDYAGKKKKRIFYDIKSSNVHQTYRGRHAQTSWQKVVSDTEGLVLTFEGKPIAAMYDMACGGVIPCDLATADVKQYPYLNRDYPCTACAKWRHCNWTHTVSVGDFEQQFHVRFRSGIPADRSLIARYDRAGVLQSVVVKTRRGQRVVSSKELYAAYKNSMKSLHCTVKRVGKDIVIAGSGYGHLLGYCQWGASFLAQDKGLTSQQLLHFYYPNVELSRFKVGSLERAGL